MPIAITRVVKDTFWQCIKYKIQNSFNNCPRNTSDKYLRLHSKNTKYFCNLFQIQNTKYSVRISNTLQHWSSPSKRWPVCHTTHGPRLSKSLKFDPGPAIRKRLKQWLPKLAWVTTFRVSTPVQNCITIRLGDSPI